MKILQTLTYLVSYCCAALLSHAASVLQFPVSTCSVTEGSGRLEVRVTRSGDLGTVVSVDLATVPGTALPGANYTGVATNLTFATGEGRRIVSVPILNDGLVGGGRTFRVVLASVQGDAELGPRASLAVTITDNDKGLHFYVPALSVNEDAGLARIKVARGDDGDHQASVDYATSDVTAKAGQHYTATTGTLVFAPGEVLKSIVAPVRNDVQPGPDRTFRVSLTNATGGGVLGTPWIATVTIQDTDQRVQLGAATYSVREDAAFIRVPLTRGESDSPGTVDFMTADATATAGLDYLRVTNTVRFAPGQREAWVDVPILQDALVEGPETFTVTLSRPTGAAILGSPTSATVSIINIHPGVGFAQPRFTPLPDTDVASVTVVRGEQAMGAPLRVGYQTRNGSAQAGLDYVAATGKVEFPPGQTLQEIRIPLLRNAAARGARDFSVTLSDPSSGPIAGTGVTTVRILHPGAWYPVNPPMMATLVWHRGQQGALLTWGPDGALERAESVAGPWVTPASANSPYALRTDSTTGFVRLQTARPTQVYVPRSYDGHSPLPLVLVLHALGFDGDAVIGYYPGLLSLAETKGFFVCAPNGTIAPDGTRFWNGPDFLDFYGSTADDSAYLRAVVEEIERHFAVDPKRIYSTGVSSGGGMSHRLACDQADLVAAIAPISGGTYYSPDDCHSSQPVHVVEIDGTADLYAGGWISGYPVVAEVAGAVRMVQNWARLNGCREPVVEAAPSLDVTSDVTGLETTVLRYTQSPPGGSVELWTLNGGGHAPTLSPGFTAVLIDWFFAHPKP